MKKTINTQLAIKAAEGFFPGNIISGKKSYSLAYDEKNFGKIKPPKGFYRSEKSAEEVREAAKAIFNAAKNRPCSVKPEGAIFIPENTKEPISFQLWEADALKTSHNPKTWSVNEEYPIAVQERDYKGTKAEQLKVQRIANNPDPFFLISESPTALDGPPVILEHGEVMGGNGRTMGLKLAYERGTADKYRTELEKRAPKFGIPSEMVRGAQKPVLVRCILDKSKKYTTKQKQAALSSALNESSSMDKDYEAQGIADARRISEETIQRFGEVLGEGSLRDAMEDHPDVFIKCLRNDGIILDTNVSEWVDAKKNNLVPIAKLKIEMAFLSLICEDLERLRGMADRNRKKLERMIPQIIHIHSKFPAHSIKKQIQGALDILQDAKAHRAKSIEEFIDQKDFTKKAYDAKEATLAVCISKKGPLELKRLVDEWVKVVKTRGGKQLFDKPATPDETFKIWKDASKPSEQN